MGFTHVMFDLDGTLLRKDLSMCPEAVALLTRWMEAGIRVGLATGRPRRSALPYIEQLKPNGPLIFFNGAQLYEGAQSQPLYSARLDFEAAWWALEIANQLGLHANLYLDDEVFISFGCAVSRASERKDGLTHVHCGSLTALLTRRQQAPIKLLLIGEPGLFPAFISRFRRVAGPEPVLVNSEPDYLEVLPPGVDKGQALRQAALHAGFALADVIAFGDNLNDFEMLDCVGKSVAMGNAHPRLRAQASHVIGPCETDAIARFLRDTFTLEGDRLVASGHPPGNVNAQ